MSIEDIEIPANIDDNGNFRYTDDSGDQLVVGSCVGSKKYLFVEMVDGDGNWRWVQLGLTEVNRLNAYLLNWISLQSQLEDDE